MVYLIDFDAIFIVGENIIGALNIKNNLRAI